MRIIFIGTVLLSESLLLKLLELKVNIVGVVTKPSSSFNNDYADIGKIALKSKIPLLNTFNINSLESILWMKNKAPDYIFCFGWSQLLRKDVLEIPTKNVIGYHPSLLPNNKGRHPLIWAKVLGLKKTGSTFFVMDEGIDSGRIVSQKEFEITFEDDANSLYNKMIQIAKSQIIYISNNLNDLYSISIPQLSEGNTWRKRSIIDGQIDFRMNTNLICNLVRGITHPYFGSHFLYNNQIIKVWEVCPYPYFNDNDEPGKILFVNENSIVVKTGDSAIELFNLEDYSLFKENEYII